MLKQNFEFEHINENTKVKIKPRFGRTARHPSQVEKWGKLTKFYLPCWIAQLYGSCTLMFYSFLRGKINEHVCDET